MSDTPQGEGWWVADDGRWYAPELHPDFTKPVEFPAPPQQMHQWAEPTIAPHAAAAPHHRSFAVQGNGRSLPLRLVQFAIPLLLIVGISAASARSAGSAPVDPLTKADCEEESQAVTDVIEANLSPSDRYLGVTDLVALGLLDREPANHVVALQGSSGDALAYDVIGVRDCAEPPHGNLCGEALESEVSKEFDLIMTARAAAEATDGAEPWGAFLREPPSYHTTDSADSFPTRIRFGSSTGQNGFWEELLGLSETTC